MKVSAVLLFVCGIVELCVGAVQLGLFYSANPYLAYAVLVGCYIVIALFVATLTGDHFIWKRYGYKVDGIVKERWEEHTGGGGDGYEPAPGRGLRLFLHFIFQTPSVYFLLLLIVG